MDAGAKRGDNLSGEKGGEREIKQQISLYWLLELEGTSPCLLCNKGPKIQRENVSKAAYSH
jgi:hypothetical protein